MTRAGMSAQGSHESGRISATSDPDRDAPRDRTPHDAEPGDVAETERQQPAARRREGRHPGVRARGHRPARQDHALRSPRRSRRQDHEGRRLWIKIRLREWHRRGRQRRTGRGRDREAGQPRADHRRRVLGVVDHQDRRENLERHRQLGRREAGGHGRRDRARPEHAEDRRDRAGGRLGQDGHDLPRFDAGRADRRCQRLRSSVEVRPARDPYPVQDRGSIARHAGMGSDQGLR
ncbi:MAG: hypothetical protein NVS9B8_12600 [Candidatus Limnocylindrales bacterium]